MKYVNLLDESAFATGAGLWTGKKGPFARATVIRNTNFTESGRVDYSDVAVLEVEAKQLASRRLKSGDIIIERSGGGPNQPVGRVVFFEHDTGVFSHSNFTSRLRVINKDRFFPKFVFYFLLYFHDSKQTDHLQRRTTGIRNLDWQAYREAAGVPLLDLAEQRHIAHLLSTVQRAIERQERLVVLTAELKKALMQKLFTEGTRGEPLKQTEIGRVPKSWETPIIGEFADIAHGYAFQSPYFTKAGPVVLTPGNFKLDGGLYWGDRTKYTTETPPNGFTLHAGDLVVVMTDLTPSAKLLGTPAFIPGEMVILHNQRIGKVVMKQSGTTLDYLYWVFLTEPFKRYMASTATGSTVRHTSPGRIKDYRFPLPKDDEQHRIIEALKACDRKCAAHEATRSVLDELFRTLLHQFMTAQARVHELDLSPLDELEVEAAEVT